MSHGFKIKRLSLWIPFTVLIILALCACGGGGGGSNKGSNANNVTITGVVDDGSQNSPIPNASCRFIDNAGQTQDTDICEQDGSFQLSVPSGAQGYIYCGPQSMSNLNLTTFSSTVGYTGGETKVSENVTPTTTVVADIIRYEDPPNPEVRKSELILLISQDPNLAIVTEIAGRLFRTMLAQQVNARFGDDRSGGGGGGDGGGGDHDGGVSGDAGDGADFSPLSEAQCSFVIGDDFENAEGVYPAALADYLGDGELDRPDLANLATTVLEGLSYSHEAIQDAFEAWFPNGLGEELTTVTDQDGYYFLPIPANLAGYVRCAPKGLPELSLGTYTPRRQANADLVDQDVTPAITVFSTLIAPYLKSEDLDKANENYLDDIAGLDTQLVFQNDELSGFQLRPGTAPNKSEVGLVAFSATALFNTFYKNNLGADFLAAFADMVERNLTVDPDFLAELGVPVAQTQALSQMVNTSVDGAETALQINRVEALSTAWVNVTLTDEAGPVSNARVDIGSLIVSCVSGCDVPTDASGQVALTLRGVQRRTTPVNLYFSSETGGDLGCTKIDMTALATVDLDLDLSDLSNNCGNSVDDFPPVVEDPEDNVSLHIIQVTPPDQSSVDINTPVVIYFDDQIDPETISDLNFVVRTADGVPIFGSISGENSVAGNTIMKFVPFDSFPELETIVVELVQEDGIQDNGGNTLEAIYTWSFNTKEVQPPLLANNLGFEQGSEGWSFSGDAGIVSGFGTLVPFAGEAMAALTTGTTLVSENDSLNSTTSTITSGQIDVPNGTQYLVVPYDFISAEFREYIGSVYDDTLAISVSGPLGSKTEIINSVNLADEASLIEISLPEDIVNKDYTLGDTFHTGQLTYSIDISSLGTPITFSFTVSDVGDTQYSSIVLIDSIEFQ